MPSKTTADLPGVTGEGISPLKIKALDNAIDDWRDVVDRRMALTENETEARDKVVELAQKNGVKKYRYELGDGEYRILDVLELTKVKLRKPGKDGASDD